MSQTIRIPDSLLALAQREAELMSRTVAQQLEHWARLGLALEASGVTASQVRHLLDMEMGRRLELPSRTLRREEPAPKERSRDADAWGDEDDCGSDRPGAGNGGNAGNNAGGSSNAGNGADDEYDEDYSDEEVAVAITCISGVLSLEDGADEADLSERELRRLMAGLLRRRRHMSLSELEALSAERRLQLATEIAFAEHAARGRR
ncbi:TA system antitoxin ParD family protein [Azohydromonas lata]|uniref:ParD-like antitoxin of type II toxin-antitoxin system n=1 Tax=Azohydromonas lata TaxID=45677 RepID=A0ABU5INE6_9BURK|nr:hypothetical protein [Azohydromonas lata]MDZ5460422.1 hypothetical protein [Azohydromonas lata]